MLLPDNILPELSIYYIGALVLDELKRQNGQQLYHLYQNIKSRNDISFPSFILSLDWLYLIDVAETNGKGEVSLCL